MVVKDIEFSVDGSDGKKIDMIYLVASRQLLIWLDKNQQPKPTVLDVDYMDMAKAKQDFCQIFNGIGSGNDEHVKNAWSEFSNRINPCVYEYYKFHKIQKGNGNGDGLTDGYAEALNNANRSIPKSAEDELAEIPNRDYSGFVINTVKKEVKRDDVLVRQVFYTGLSTYTFDPINLGIMSPTSEGKSYTTEKVIQYFPEKDVWNVGAWSNKVLIRQKGILINSKGQSIQKQVDELREKQRNINTATIRLEFQNPNTPKEREPEPKMTFQEKVKQEVEKRKADVKKELDSILADAIILITLQGKLLVFYEPPQRDFWNLIKPVLSHGRPEISYDYVDRTEGGRIQTQKLIVRGWPAVIFCSAKDESKWEIWPEIQSRFLITSPNMSQDKVHDGNILIAQRKGLPNWRQQQVIVSDKERELARKAASFLKDWMGRLSELNGLDYDHRNAVWIPYFEILADALKSERGTDNRITARMLSLLNIIALIKVHHRSNLVSGKERQVIATLEDLSETLYITQNLSGIPPHKLKFFKESFLPPYQSKTAPDISEDGTKTEDRVGITTSEIRDFHKAQTGKSITTKNIVNTYLIELENNGFIDKQESKIDKRKNYYFPIVEIPKQQKMKKFVSESPITNFLQFNKIIPSKYFKKIEKDWLEVEISTLKNSLVELDSNAPFQFYDENDKEITIEQFVKNYSKQGNLTNYFVMPDFSNNYNDNT
jgi:hypothetical protein